MIVSPNASGTKLGVLVDRLHNGTIWNAISGKSITRYQSPVSSGHDSDRKQQLNKALDVKEILFLPFKIIFFIRVCVSCH